jgi:high-affinity iron transporter
MVGEQVQEMQLAHWIPTTTIPALADVIPAWMGLWLSVFPTVETLAGQAIAALLVIGSYSIAQRRTAALPTVLPSDNETPAHATQTSVSEQTAPTRLQEAS